MTASFCFPPSLLQVAPACPAPFFNQTAHTRRQTPTEQSTRFNVDHSRVLGVLDVHVCRRVIVMEQSDHDAEKDRDDRHGPSPSTREGRNRHAPVRHNPTRQSILRVAADSESVLYGW